MTNHNNIPQQLKALDRWIVFSVSDPDEQGKRKKQPKNARTGGNAMSNNPQTWTDFATAQAAQTTGRFEHIGLATGDGIVGIDLDHVIKDGQLIPQARDIVNMFDSYTEISLSGDGLHIVCKGDLPSVDEKNKYKFHLPDGAELEMFYSQFLILTGNVFEGKTELHDCDADVQKLWIKYYTEQQKKTETTQQQATAPSDIADISDSELIDKAMNATNGDKFRRLWNGDTSDYNSDHSSADLALCQMLAFWTCRDERRIDDLFRQSALYRDKWDRKTKGTTYGNITIAKAVAACGQVYEPDTPNHRVTETPTNQITASPNHQITTGDTDGYIDDYDGRAVSPFTLSPITFYIDGQFKQDTADFNATTTRRSGFKLFDEKIGNLRPDLYIFGAMTGMGKTTFALQLADQLAEQGEPVLYFSFEQTRHEIVAKSLARYSQKTGKFDPNNHDVWPQDAETFKSGNLNSAGRDAIAEYKATHDNLFYIVDVTDTNFNVSVDKVVQTVDYFCDNFQVTPCVFIDYLQVMQARNQRADARMQTDEIINKLKQLQQRHKLFMFVISAFNRENYINPVSLESFKESGRIEYTAGYIFGMQYSVMGHEEERDSKIFTGETDKSKNFRRDIIKQEQQRDDGKKYLQIVALKTRYNQPMWAIDFVVDHQAETFTEITADEYFAAHGGKTVKKQNARL